MSPVNATAGLPVLLAVALYTTTAVSDATTGNREEGAGINSLVEQAIADLAQRESVAPAAISLERYEEVTWPDSSLGCPRPGMHYRQVPMDGARIVLKLGDVLWEYHSGGNRPLFLCRSGGQLIKHRR